jgi:hypothetical protein
MVEVEPDQAPLNLMPDGLRIILVIASPRASAPIWVAGYSGKTDLELRDVFNQIQVGKDTATLLPM